MKDSEEYEQVLRPTLKKISFHVYIFQSAALLGCYYLFFCIPYTRLASGLQKNSCRKNYSRFIFGRTSFIPFCLFTAFWQWQKASFNIDLLNKNSSQNFLYNKNHPLLKATYFRDLYSKFLAKKESIEGGLFAPTAASSRGEKNSQQVNPLEKDGEQSQKSTELSSKNERLLSSTSFSELEEDLERDNYFSKSFFGK